MTSTSTVSSKRERQDMRRKERAAFNEIYKNSLFSSILISGIKIIVHTLDDDKDDSEYVNFSIRHIPSGQIYYNLSSGANETWNDDSMRSFSGALTLPFPVNAANALTFSVYKFPDNGEEGCGWNASFIVYGIDDAGKMIQLLSDTGKTRFGEGSGNTHEWQLSASGLMGGLEKMLLHIENDISKNLDTSGKTWGNIEQIISVPVIKGNGTLVSTSQTTFYTTIKGKASIQAPETGTWSICVTDVKANKTVFQGDGIRAHQEIPINYKTGMNTQLKVDAQWSEKTDTTLSLHIKVTY